MAKCIVCGETDPRQFEHYYNRAGTKVLCAPKCRRCQYEVSDRYIYAIPQFKDVWGRLLWADLEHMVHDGYAPEGTHWLRTDDRQEFIVVGEQQHIQRLEAV